MKSIYSKLTLAASLCILTLSTAFANGSQARLAAEEALRKEKLRVAQEVAEGKIKLENGAYDDEVSRIANERLERQRRGR